MISVVIFSSLSNSLDIKSYDDFILGVIVKDLEISELLVLESFELAKVAIWLLIDKIKFLILSFNIVKSGGQAQLKWVMTIENK